MTEVLSRPAAHRNRFQLLLTEDSVAEDFTARVPQLGVPAGEGIVRGLGVGRIAPSGAGGDVGSGGTRLRLVPLAQGDVDNTLAWRIIGWNQIAPPSNLWVPQQILRGTATIGAMVGDANDRITQGIRFAKSIAIQAGEGYAGSSAVVSIPKGTAEEIASVIVDLVDFQVVEVQLHINASSVRVNALVSIL